MHAVLGFATVLIAFMLWERGVQTPGSVKGRWLH